MKCQKMSNLTKKKLDFQCGIDHTPGLHHLPLFKKLFLVFPQIKNPKNETNVLNMGKFFEFKKIKLFGRKKRGK